MQKGRQSGQTNRRINEDFKQQDKSKNGPTSKGTKFMRDLHANTFFQLL